MENELSDLENALLDVFKAHPGRWLSRSDVAHAIDRKDGKLYPYDVQLLDALVDRGLIKKEHRVYRTVAKRYEYTLAD